MVKYCSLIGVCVITAIAISLAADGAPDPNLKIVIIRHAEKPDDGDNLSCKGMNRALQLPAVLKQKVGIPDHTYVPTLDCGKSTNHARMFQTIAPFAVKHNLKINSSFGEKDFDKVAPDVLKRHGTVLMVWEHSAIPALAESLGIKDPPKFKDGDFDSIWTITFPSGVATLTLDKEGLTPSDDCPY